MTDNTHIQPYIHQDTPVTTTRSLQILEAEARAMDTAFRIAKGLSRTQMVPEHFQVSARDRNGKENGETATWNLAAAILYGAELGMTPAQAAQNVFIVKGKPAVYARTMAAQVRAAGYKLQEVEASDERVVWRAERDGHWTTSEWTIQRAEQAGYTSNAKYRSNPMEMLRAKCIAEVCRISFQDVLLGMAYTVEDLTLDNVTVQRVVKKEAKGASALRELAAKATNDPQPQIDGNENSATEDDRMATSEQTDTIRSLYNDAGLNGQAMLGEVTEYLQLEGSITDLLELSREDADDIIKSFNTPQG
jgi:hypothetical protein